MKRTLLALICTALAFAAFEASAAGRPRGGWHGTGLFAAPAPSAPAATYRWSGFHHHPSFFVGGTFFSPWWPYGYYYYPPPPYYYGPDFQAHYEMPTVYVEKFEGTPSAETVDDIYCPAASAYYPDVKECPTGWQRIIRPAG